MQLGRTAHDGLDDAGDVVEDVEQSYTGRGRLSAATIDSDGDEDVDVTTTYTYDDSGIRVRQVVEQASQATSVTEFVVDHQNATGYAQTIAERSREGSTPTRQVAYTIGLDEVVQAVKDNPAASAVVSQFLHDGRGSVRQLADALAELVQAATKDAVAVLKLDYTAYGTAVNYAAETVATALLHNGEFVDPVTGQQYLRARWYDQATGRFNRVDPFAGEASIPQSLHKYLFAHGDPNSHTDPSGEIIPLLIPAGIFAAQFVTFLKTLLFAASAGALIGGLWGGVDSALGGDSFGDGFARGAAFGALAGPIFAVAPGWAVVPMGSVLGATALVGAAESLSDGKWLQALWRTAGAALAFGGARRAYGRGPAPIQGGLTMSEYMAVGTSGSRVLRAAGLNDGVIGIRGSLVTGVRRDGNLLDKGPKGVSDVDLFIASRLLFDRAVSAGFEVHGRGTRTRALKGAQLERLGLGDLFSAFSGVFKERPVSVMIYRSMDDVVGRLSDGPFHVWGQP